MASTTARLNLLPGDTVPHGHVPSSQQKKLKLGPGLAHLPPSTIKASVAGTLHADFRKNALWMEYNGGRYTPHAPDLVIGTVHHSSADTYHVQLSPHTPLASLPHLAFEAATKKTRPQLLPGDLVYARVAAAARDLDPELECVAAGGAGKADGLGPLRGGMLFDVSVGFARRLMAPKGRGGGGGAAAAGLVLDVLAGTAAAAGGRQGLVFEVAIGRNGRVWVDGEDVRVVVAVGRCLGEVDAMGTAADEARVGEVVARVLKELGL